MVIAYKRGKTQVFSTSGDTASRVYGVDLKKALCLIFRYTGLIVVKRNVKTKTKLFTNECYSHLPYGSRYPLKWTEPGNIWLDRQ